MMIGLVAEGKLAEGIEEEDIDKRRYFVDDEIINEVREGQGEGNFWKWGEVAVLGDERLDKYLDDDNHHYNHLTGLVVDTY